MTTGSKQAASSSTCAVPPEISVAAPPMTPARPSGPESSAMTRSSVVSARSWPSRVTSRSPSVARRATTAPESLSRSYACSGCPSSSITALVTSTARLMERIPASTRRRCSHAGDGTEGSSAKLSATKRVHADGSSMRSGWPAGASPGGTRPGSASSSPNAVATSRATPRTDSV